MRNIVVAIVSTLTVAACSGAPQKGGGENQESRPLRGRIAEKDGVSENGKSWGGWRWKGQRDACFYIFENECFSDKAAACKAAACGDMECEVKEGAPMIVSCSKTVKKKE